MGISSAPSPVIKVRKLFFTGTVARNFLLERFYTARGWKILHLWIFSMLRTKSLTPTNSRSNQILIGFTSVLCAPMQCVLRRWGGKRWLATSWYRSVSWKPPWHTFRPCFTRPSRSLLASANLLLAPRYFPIKSNLALLCILLWKTAVGDWNETTIFEIISSGSVSALEDPDPDSS